MQEFFDWADYVVVGTGIGAAAFAHQMVSYDKNVLLLEAGSWPFRDEKDWNPKSILIEGRYTDNPIHPKVLVQQYGRSKEENVLTRPVVGGMSVFYGAAAFRLREKDFERWPDRVGYSTYEPYYELAESLMCVSGDDSSDPTRPRRNRPLVDLVPLSKATQRIRHSAKKLGLNPFSVPLAIRFKGDRSCVLCNTCDGFPCKISAKIDGSTILKSIMDGPKSSRIKILTNIFVESLNVTSQKVQAIVCKTSSTRDQKQVYKVKNVILGAGSIGSAALLLRSLDCNDERLFPSRDQFGRNLLRHANAIVGALFFKKTNPEQEFCKQTVIADFYEDMRKATGFATGVIQDIYTPHHSVVRHFAPKPLGFAAGMLSQYIQNLLCVAEDEPQMSNRVYLGSRGEIKISHSYTSDDVKRRDHLVSQAKRILKNAGGILPQVMLIDSFSHAVATLRMGLTPEDSATDCDGRLWGFDNIFVADGSVIPASGGVNPSLTIAANAIKLADDLSKTR